MQLLTFEYMLYMFPFQNKGVQYMEYILINFSFGFVGCVKSIMYIIKMWLLQRAQIIFSHDATQMMAMFACRDKPV